MGSLMKTTIEMSDPLFKSAKELAQRSQTTLRALIEEGLRMRLKSEQQPTTIAKPPMPVFFVLKGEGGLMPGIDGTSNRSMFDAADDAG